jgi:hypothetical protein
MKQCQMNSWDKGYQMKFEVFMTFFYLYEIDFELVV